MHCLKKVTINEIEDYLVNHLIEYFESLKIWKGDKAFSKNDDIDLTGFRFSNDSIPAFSIEEQKALKKCHFLLMGNEDKEGVFTSSYNELTGIMTLNLKGSDDVLIIALLNEMFESLSSFYIEKAIEKQQYDYDLIKSKYDSINNVLAGVQYQLASFEDKNKDLYRKTELLRRNRLKIDEQKLIMMSGKAEEQLQMSLLALENKTPFIQVIDRPLLPLTANNKGLLFNIVFGGLIGFILAFIMLILLKMYRDIMAG